MDTLDWENHYYVKIVGETYMVWVNRSSLDRGDTPAYFKKEEYEEWASRQGK